jgi:hypothetical protein
MNEKKINRYSIVELIDIIKNETDKILSEKAELELKSRDLTEKQLKKFNNDYEKFKKFQLERKDKPLTTEEWLTFFFLPFFTPRPKWRTNDHFTESEFKRFEKYGFQRKSKEASKVKLFGILFWILVIIVIILAERLYGE